MKSDDFFNLEFFNWDQHHRCDGKYRCDGDSIASLLLHHVGTLITVSTKNGKHVIHVEEIQFKD